MQETEEFMLSDIEIARQAKIRPIAEFAASIGIPKEYVLLYGNTKAKIKLEILEHLATQKDAIYVDVTAITPTPLGEGKTTTSVGLTQGLGKLGCRAAVCLRQPSLGPTFGIKGGAAGGGYAQVVPMEDFNLHLTGDMHAVSAAHNLIAAALDARLMHERNYNDKQWQKRNLPRLQIDPYQITWHRVVDINDRALRNICIGLGTAQDGYPRQTGFDITPASELMAILALSKNLQDLRQRIGRAIVALDVNKEPITVEKLGVAGAATVLLRDALMPNLMQTLEGQPAFVHAGPFANIAHGNNSIVADYIALKLSDVVVTESGFGADMGMEKFFHIKCRTSGKMPNVIVLVATVRALKMHGGGPAVVSGAPLAPEYQKPNPELVARGTCNLARNIQIARNFGVPVVVAINRFPNDSAEELQIIQQAAKQAGAFAAVIAEHHTKGGEGARELAQAVLDAAKAPQAPHFLYDLASTTIEQKIETIATQVYGAAKVQYEDKALEQIARWKKIGLGALPICMAKTQYSLSHDPDVKGVPTGFTLPIREVKASAGAGFLYPLCGDIQLMPGLPSNPAFMEIDVDEHGNILGLE